MIELIYGMDGGLKGIKGKAKVRDIREKGLIKASQSFRDR